MRKQGLVTTVSALSLVLVAAACSGGTQFVSEPTTTPFEPTQAAVTPTPEVDGAPTADGAASGSPAASASDQPSGNAPEAPSTEAVGGSPTRQAGRVLPANTLALYLSVNQGSKTDRLRLPQGGAVTLQSSDKAVILYLPETDDRVMVDSYTSPSYSRNYVEPYTVNDRLFLVRYFWDTGSHDYREIDPQTNRSLSSSGTTPYTSRTNYAAVGDDFYFVRSSPPGTSRAPAPQLITLRPRGGGLQLIDNTAGALLSGQLLGGGDELYWVWLPQENVIDFYEVDQATGDLSLIRSVTFTPEVAFTDWDFAVTYST